jgi:heat shock protein HslJ
LYPSFALGDLNDDGQEDAAALLLTTTGGEEVFVDLVGVRNQYGLPLPLSSVTLGDRVHVDWMVIQNGEILLDLTAQGPNDAPCCPTQKERHVYRLLGDKLAKVAITVVKTPTPTRPWRPFPTSPVGAVWEWTEYQDQAGGSDIVVDEPARYTLEMAPDGTYNLRADCNNRVGEYTLKGSSLSIGAGQGPRINCGQGSLSDQYLDLLSDVSSFVLKDGVLSLVLKMDAGQMLFRPAE